MAIHLNLFVLFCSVFMCNVCLSAYLPGDINNDGLIGLEDSITGLQISTGMSISGELGGDVDGDTQIGMSHGVYFDDGCRPDSWNLLGRLNVSYYNYYTNRELIAYQTGKWAESYPDLAVIPNDYSVLTGSHWLDPEGCVFGENIVWKTQRLLVNGTWGGYQNASDYFTRADPLFVDEMNGNLNLMPDSPAFDMEGFIAIPFSQIGIIVK